MIAGIVLAAGLSSRFGGANKLVAPIEGVPLIRRVAMAALASKLDRVVVVLGHQADTVRAVLADLARDERLAFIENVEPEKGQSGSVRIGLGVVAADCDAALFLMGDQPYLEPRIIDALIDAHQGGITLPAVGGQRRNPVIFDRQFYPDILALAGDTGARAIIEANRARVTAVPFEAERPFADIDKAEDLDRLARSRP